MTASDDARRARQRANSAAYRARQKAAAAERKPHSQPLHGGGSVEKAKAEAKRIRAARADALTKLPSVFSVDKNAPLGENTPRLRPVINLGRGLGPIPKTKTAQTRQAAAIREVVNSEKIIEVGKARRDELRIELTDGPRSERLQEMGRHDRERFADLTEQISGISAQALGVLFNHAGGSALYFEAIAMIQYPPTRAAGFAILETLADYAGLAEQAYSPRALRAQGLGDKRGYLRH